MVRLILKIFLMLISTLWVDLRASDWIKLVGRDFVVISEVSDSRTRAWARDFQLFQDGIEQLLPLSSRTVQPVAVVLFSSDRKLKPFKPIENGKPALVGGYFVRTPGRNLIALSVDGARDDVRERVFHEATHWYLDSAEFRLPLWMDEGLAEVFSTFTISGSTFTVGMPPEGFVRYLRTFERMGFSKLSSKRPGGLVFGGKHENETRMFYIESWAVAHFLLLRNGVSSLLQMQRFLKQPAFSGNLTERILEIFEQSGAKVDEDIAAYISRKSVFVLKQPFARKFDLGSFVLSPASDGEVEFALGNLLIGVGRPLDAKPYFERALKILPDDPRPREGLGEIALSQNQVVEARVRFEEAVALGGNSYFGHYLAAIANLREINDSSHDGGQRSAYEVAARNVVKAIKVNPRFREGYELLGSLAAFLFRSQAGEISPVLTEGNRRFPGSPSILIGLAYCAHGQGRTAEALTYVRNASESSDPEVQKACRVAEAEIRSQRLPPMLRR